jgi:precorrin-6B methylase 2
MHGGTRIIDSRVIGRPHEQAWRDPRAFQVHRPQLKRDVPFVPTEAPVVAAMLELARVGPEDVVYDLGCGDGRIAIAAAKLGAQAVGVDIDLQRIHEATENVKRAGMSGKIQLHRQSFFDVDLRAASVVTMYLLPSINVKLRPKLMWELRPGARIISNNFEMGDWPPDETFPIFRRTLYKWIVPAWVQGRWRCITLTPGGREHMSFQFERRYQKLLGTARVARENVAIRDGRIRGDLVSFTIWHPKSALPLVKYSGKVEGNSIRGTAEAGVERFAWGAMREDGERS